METNAETIGGRIKRTMEVKGLSASKLAKLAGIKDPAMSLILSDKRNPGRTVLANIANALSVTEDFLLGKKANNESVQLLANPAIADLVDRFCKLNVQDQKRLLSFLDALEASAE